jgi:hypothetical protein
MGADFIEAVGKGTVTVEAVLRDKNLKMPDNEVLLPNYDKCDIMLLLNGEETTSIDVEDGDRIEVELIGTGECGCCKVQMDCISETASMWVRKNSRDGNVIQLSQNEILDKVKFVANRISKRKRRLR